MEKRKKTTLVEVMYHEQFMLFTISGLPKKYILIGFSKSNKVFFIRYWLERHNSGHHDKEKDASKPQRESSNYTETIFVNKGTTTMSKGNISYYKR